MSRKCSFKNVCPLKSGQFTEVVKNSQRAPFNQCVFLVSENPLPADSCVVGVCIHCEERRHD